MKTRKLMTAVVLSLPMLVALPGQASAQCINGINASVLGDANQSNECTTLVVPAAPAP